MKNNIIWLASYPKSGNTMVRAFLSAYFFTKDGILKDFSPLKNITSFNQFSNFKYIKDFPNINFFKKNPESVSKYWLLNQKIINQKLNKEVIFFKTHSARIKYQSEYFTNNELTRLFIYIVRDPRSVVISSKLHYGFKNNFEAVKVLLSDKWVSYATEKPKLLPEFILSWKTNYLSWQNFYAKNKNKGIIIRFEDLASDPEKGFSILLKFLSNHLNFSIDKTKLSNSIRSTYFDNLKFLEKKIGFEEKSKKSIQFFRQGKTDEWQTILEEELKKTILDNCEKEMLYLNYI